MQSYKTASKNIVHQMIDNEAIVVDLVRGFYFSITGSGSIIWQHLINGLTRDQIVHLMLMSYDASQAEIEDAVDKLITQLLDESLLVESAEFESSLPEQPGNPLKQAFEPLKFEKYTDMDSALMLDPIHDTDESGWPCQSVATVETVAAT